MNICPIINEKRKNNSIKILGESEIILEKIRNRRINLYIWDTGIELPFKRKKPFMESMTSKG